MGVKANGHFTPKETVLFLVIILGYASRTRYADYANEFPALYSFSKTTHVSFYRPVRRCAYSADYMHTRRVRFHTITIRII